jgi:leader peptidase (prepilin peptidase)/N-methyltransferase
MNTAMLSFFVFFLGAIIGSFLNCLIYRLPRNLSLSDPKRSFCPKCERPLPWFENLPIVSWLLLKGNCAGCHAPISMRYPLVETVTAFLFWRCYLQLGFPVAVAAWIFVALLITATLIDLEHLLIPDEITLGGIALGLGSSFFLPQLMGVHSHLVALAYSFASAAVAYLILWTILEIGKKVFGKKKICFDEPQILELLENKTHFLLQLGEEFLPLEELFSRTSDRIVAKATWLEIAEKKYASQTLIITPDHVHISEPAFNVADLPQYVASASTSNLNCPKATWTLEEALPLRCMITQITLPREAMGFGDVKFLACIASFLGMKGALFSLFGGSILGAITGCILLLATRGRLGKKLPFGPYLAVGALLWMLRW